METLTGSKKKLNDVLGAINTLRTDIESRMVNGAQANTTADWHDAWANLAPGIVMSIQMMVMMDKGEIAPEDKAILSQKAEEFLAAIREVDAHDRTAGEPRLQAIVEEIKAKIVDVLSK